MTDIWILALIICALIILSAFFSSAETALTAASDARMRQLARKGNKQAALVEKLRGDRESLIGSILIGNNAVNVLASSVATSAAIMLVGDGGIVIATIAMTILLVLFAEVLPKTYAFNHADRFALRIARPIQLIVWCLVPLSAGVRWLAVVILGKAPEAADTREEELRGLIELHSEDSDDVESKETNAMLSSVLDLGELSVDQIMTHRASVSMINADDVPDDIVRFVMTSPYTRHPVFSGKPENIIGVLHVKALLRAIEEAARGAPTQRDLNQLNIARIASPAYFVPETTQLFAQLQAFRTRREHFALVVDEYGDFRGIVTLEDILEEIVGDIDDETDEELAGCVPQADGSYLIDGGVTIRDLNRTLDLELPDDQASTIAGLLLHESRTIPAAGQEFRFFNLRFRVVHREGNKLTQLRLWTRWQRKSTESAGHQTREGH